MRYNGNKMEYIYDTLVPKGLLTPDWFTKPADYFLPPAAFSRMDSMQVRDPLIRNIYFLVDSCFNIVLFILENVLMKIIIASIFVKPWCPAICSHVQ